MQAAHEMAGERIYELSPELKRRFDDCFPCIRGQYPKLAVEVIPLDTEENQAIPDLSGVLIKYEVRYEQRPEWEVKDQSYEIRTEIDCSEANVTIDLRSHNKSLEMFAYKKNGIPGGIFWPELFDEYGLAKMTSLEEEFEKLSACPRTEELGEVWQIFEEDMDIYAAWKTYHDYQQEKEFSFNSADCGCPSLDMGRGNAQNAEMTYAYQGVVADCHSESHTHFTQGSGSRAIFFLERECKPVVEVNRSKIVGLPLKALIAIGGISHKNGTLEDVGEIISSLNDWQYATLQEWRQAGDLLLEQWLNRYLDKYFEGVIQEYQKSWNTNTSHSLNCLLTYGYDTHEILDKYVIAYLQDHYFMTISYEEGQIITFQKKTVEEREDVYDLFPPIMFCKAASDQSRRVICHVSSLARRGDYFRSSLCGMVVGEFHPP